MRILLELSPSGVRVDQFLADTLRDQVVVSRVLAELEPDLSTFGKAVRGAYDRARRATRASRGGRGSTPRPKPDYHNPVI
jgi:hypothetical protein